MPNTSMYVQTDPNDSATGYGGEDWGSYGLSKREHFAAIALQGILANPELAKNTIPDDVQMAVEYANALIAELNK